MTSHGESKVKLNKRKLTTIEYQNWIKTNTLNRCLSLSFFLIKTFIVKENRHYKPHKTHAYQIILLIKQTIPPVIKDLPLFPSPPININHYSIGHFKYISFSGNSISLFEKGEFTLCIRWIGIIFYSLGKRDTGDTLSNLSFFLNNTANWHCFFFFLNVRYRIPHNGHFP